MEYNRATDSFSDGFNTVSAKDLEQGERARFPTPAPTRHEPTVTVGRGGTEVTVSNGEMVVRKDSDRVNTFQAATGFAREGDLLSTARNPSGSPVVGRPLRPTDTVEFRGQRAPLQVFQSLGIVTKDGGGNWAATAEGNAGASMPEGKTPQVQLADGGTVERAEAEGFRADDATEAVLTELVEGVGPATQLAALNAYARTGEVSPRVVEMAAAEAGLDPEAMAAKISAAQAGMEHAVAGRLEAAGVFDQDLFAEWVQGSGERSGAAREALFALMTGNSTAGLDRLAESFVETLDQIDPVSVAEALEASGIPFRSDRGRVIIRTPEGEFSYGSAVKLGLIKVSKA